jgi:glycosyltransferase involved in cell wall biosynthesis
LTLLISKFLKAKIGVFADTWTGRDKEVSFMQRIARRVYTNYFADAFIGASRKTLEWFRHYNKNIAYESLFQSMLCADNEYFEKHREDKQVQRIYDIMFSGRIVEEKNPLFFADVARRVKEKMGSCRVLVIGDGDEDLKKRFFTVLEENGVEKCFPGFIEHSRLPEYYSQARILVFPTAGDCWGVVINEAFVSGVPVLTTNMTAAAGELVWHGKNGYILPVDAAVWAEKIAGLLRDTEKLKEFSTCAKEAVKPYNFERAAQGIIDAFESLNGEPGGKSAV